MTETETTDNLPPAEMPVMFLAGEFGCTPRWYAGYMWQSSLPGQQPKFYIYPWWLGFDPSYPNFGAPPYLGEWRPITDQRMLDFIHANRQDNAKTLKKMRRQNT